MAKKTIMQKAAEAVDHLIHPNAQDSEIVAEEIQEKEIENEVIETPKSSSQDSELQSHPKFAKFNLKGVKSL